MRKHIEINIRKMTVYCKIPKKNQLHSICRWYRVPIDKICDFTAIEKVHLRPLTVVAHGCNQFHSRFLLLFMCDVLFLIDCMTCFYFFHVV